MLRSCGILIHIEIQAKLNSDYVSEHLIDGVVKKSQENRIWNKQGPNNIYRYCCRYRWRHIYSWQIVHIVVVKLKITNGKGEIMRSKLQRNALQPFAFIVVQSKFLNNFIFYNHDILVIIMLNQ